MGCDIHLFVETSRKPKDDEKPWWRGFGGRMNPGRDYGMFAILAGVRNYHDHPVLIPPRGVPSDIGWQAQDEWWLRVMEDDSNDGDEERTCSLMNAEAWVKSGFSIPRYERADYLDNKTGEHGKLTHVSDPDAHTASWMTGEEFRHAVQRRVDAYPIIPEDEKTHFNGIDAEYKAICSALETFEKEGRDTRVVFWFDN